jgi:hypothetical protein
VLIVGGEALAGHGVTSHDLALTGALARSLSRQMGHGVDTDAVIGEHMDLDSAEDAVWKARLQRYDALVLVLEPDRARHRTADFDHRFHSLLLDAASRMPHTSALTVAIAPFLHTPTMSAREYATFLDSVRNAAVAGTQVVELAAPVTALDPSQLYTGWADQLALTTAASLTEPAVWSDSLDVVDDGRRSVATSRLGDFDARWEAAFANVVSAASTAYGTRMASISVIDASMTHYTVCIGDVPHADPREDSICDRVVNTYGGVIVGDAREDPRFADLTRVVSGDVRFYAGYRINDADGVPVAALCVYDSEPRTVLAQDIAVLRDLALAAERRLWDLLHERSSSAGGTAKD